MNCLGRMASVSILARSIGATSPPCAANGFILAFPLSLFDFYKADERIVYRRADTCLCALPGTRPVNKVDLADTPRLMIQQGRRFRLRDTRAERACVCNRVAHRNF